MKHQVLVLMIQFTHLLIPTEEIIFKYDVTKPCVHAISQTRSHDDEIQSIIQKKKIASKSIVLLLTVFYVVEMDIYFDYYGRAGTTIKLY